MAPDVAQLPEATLQVVLGITATPDLPIVNTGLGLDKVKPSGNSGSSGDVATPDVEEDQGLESTSDLSPVIANVVHPLHCASKTRLLWSLKSKGPL